MKIHQLFESPMVINPKELTGRGRDEKIPQESKSCVSFTNGHNKSLGKLYTIVGIHSNSRILFIEGKKIRMDMQNRNIPIQSHVPLITAAVNIFKHCESSTFCDLSDIEKKGMGNAVRNLQNELDGRLWMEDNIASFWATREIVKPYIKEILDNLSTIIKFDSSWMFEFRPEGVDYLSYRRTGDVVPYDIIF